MRFGLEDGWDFSRAAHRKQLLRLCDELEPDEIYMSPKCTLWSRTQQINVHNEAQAQGEVDHETHLAMCKKLNYAKYLGRLPGHQAIFDQCAYGAVTEAGDGSLTPIKKTTRLQTAKWAMHQLMSKRCGCSSLKVFMNRSTQSTMRRKPSLEFSGSLDQHTATKQSAQHIAFIATGRFAQFSCDGESSF